MKILQMLPALAYGDAIGQEVLAMHKILQQEGYETHIYSLRVDERVPFGIYSPVKELPPLEREDVVILHVSIGSELLDLVAGLACRRVMVYHNITPAEYLKGYDETLYNHSVQGRQQLERLRDSWDYCLADSEYNRQELVDMGYSCPIQVLPIILPFEQYDKLPDINTLLQYSGDGVTNFMFLGRVAPNKKQQDCIASFAHYQRHYNPQSRLFLVGSWAGHQRYYDELVAYTGKLEAQNVVFTGHVSFKQILAYYTLADVFLCMSEHEGFCVPLIEAMYFGVPVMAFAAAAVPDTMAGQGVLLHSRQPNAVAAQLHRLVRDPLLRRQIAAGQRERLKALSYPHLRGLFLQYVGRVVGLPLP